MNDRRSVVRYRKYAEVLRRLAEESSDKENKQSLLLGADYYEGKATYLEHEEQAET